MAQWSALVTLFMHINFPEDLDIYTWMEKVKQLQWLERNNFLPMNFKK